MNEMRFCELRFRAESREVAGTIIRYGDTADIAGIFRERVKPGAFTLRDGLLLNVQHHRALPLARLGRGMSIENEPDGLTMRARLPDTSIAKDAIANIKAGLLTGLSVEMKVSREQWNDDASERDILAAQLVGIGLVDSPAYPQSSIEARQAHLQGAVLQKHPFGVWYL